MYWIDRKEGESEAQSSTSGDAKIAKMQNRRKSAPHMVISGRQLREEILSYGPAFLEPHRFSESDAFRALVTVLAAYALGSRTAARLVRERQIADPSWQPPSRREAMQVVSSLNRLRQYLPYLLGQRIQAAASATTGTPQPEEAQNLRETNPRAHAQRSNVTVSTTTPSKPVVNTRPPPPRTSGVVVRPVISLNRR